MYLELLLPFGPEEERGSRDWRLARNKTPIDWAHSLSYGPYGYDVSISAPIYQKLCDSKTLSLQPLFSLTPSLRPWHIVDLFYISVCAECIKDRLTSSDSAGELDAGRIMVP